MRAKSCLYSEISKYAFPKSLQRSILYQMIAMFLRPCLAGFGVASAPYSADVMVFQAVAKTRI